MKLKSLAMIALTTCTLIVIGTGIAKAGLLKNVPHTAFARISVLAQSVPEEDIIPPEVEAVNQATLEYLQQGRENLSQLPTIRRTVIEENYALVTWNWGEAGGQTALSFSDMSWAVSASGGGAVNVSTLEAAGIPTEIAEQLIESDQAGWQ